MTGQAEALGVPSIGRRLLAFLRNLPPVYPALAILLVIAALTRPQLLSLPLLLLIVRQAAPLGIAVIGQSLVMRSLSLDLSFGGVVLGATYILTSGLLPWPEPVLMLTCLLFGLAVGALNGFFIVKIRASAVIVTLAMALILSGVVIAFSQLRAPGNAGAILKFIGTTKLGIVPVAPFVWLALAIPAALFLRRSVFGRFLDAAGANPHAALSSGIPYLRILFSSHVASSLLAVISAFVLVGFVGVGSLSIGQDLALNSLAAAILGGVTFGAGRGGIIGPALGAFFLTFLFNFLTSYGLAEPGKLMLQGLIIAVAAMLYASRGNR